MGADNEIPQILWYKDGLVVNNPDYRIGVSPDGTCTLSIEETMIDDSAM